MKLQYKRFFNIISTIILLVIDTTIFRWLWYSYIVNMGASTFIEFKGKGNIAIIGIYVLFLFFFTNTFGGYKVGYLKITDVCLSHIMAIICANIVEYAELCIVLYKWLPPWVMVIFSIVEIIISIVWAFVFRHIYVMLYPPHSMLLIYGDRIQNELVDKISEREDKYVIKESISIKEGMPAIYEKIKKFESVIVGDIPSETRNAIVKFCFANDIRAYVTPKISDIIITGAEEINLFDTQLLLSRNYGLSGEQLLMKRTFDIFISLFLIIILSPFMLITAISIKLYDKGPIFYKQERLTIGGRKFDILKFRSMKMDSERNGARLAMKDDDRVTPVGKIIRPLHFDEIPQLVNILKGDMSFVGPRPEREVIAKQYEQEVPEFTFRLKVKAGLTGYAQVYGKYNTTPYDKLKLDLTYISKYSFWLDMKIIFMTLKVIFSKENSEGVSSDQVTASKK